jgi:hypothetical protein
MAETASASDASFRSKLGFTARARSTNNRTAAERTPSSTLRDGTGERCSALTHSPSRDVAIVVTPAVRARIVSTESAAAFSTCSQLSRTTSRRRPDRASAMASVTLWAPWGATRSAAATASGTAAGLFTGASSTNHAPSANSPTKSPATRSASRVLPTPPTPVRVTSRWLAANLTRSATSASRPTKLVVSDGRFPGFCDLDGQLAEVVEGAFASQRR